MTVLLEEEKFALRLKFTKSTFKKKKKKKKRKKLGITCTNESLKLRSGTCITEVNKVMKSKTTLR